MATLLTEQTIHLVECDPDVADSLFCMMNAIDCRVNQYQNGNEFLSAKNLKSDDVIIAELDEQRPETFTLVNQLLYMATRPGIILVCKHNNSVKTTDLFPAGRIEVLFHPFTSDKLKSTIRKLNAITT